MKPNVVPTYLDIEIWGQFLDEIKYIPGGAVPRLKDALDARPHTGHWWNAVCPVIIRAVTSGLRLLRPIFESSRGWWRRPSTHSTSKRSSSIALVFASKSNALQVWLDGMHPAYDL